MVPRMLSRCICVLCPLWHTWPTYSPQKQCLRPTLCAACSRSRHVLSACMRINTRMLSVFQHQVACIKKRLKRWSCPLEDCEPVGSLVGMVQVPEPDHEHHQRQGSLAAGPEVYGGEIPVHFSPKPCTNLPLKQKWIAQSDLRAFRNNCYMIGGIYNHLLRISLQEEEMEQPALKAKAELHQAAIRLNGASFSWEIEGTLTLQDVNMQV